MKKEIPVLWQHQKDSVMKAIPLHGFAFFAEMGCGKTGMAISTLRYKYHENNRILKTLVLCPVVVVEQWRREFIKFSRVGDKVTTLTGTGKKRLDKFMNNAWFTVEGVPRTKNAIFVTNYETLNMKELYQSIYDWQPEVLIIDESHKIKNHKSKRTKSCIILADRARYKYILTGTPILNTPMDIFSQYRVLDGGQSFGQKFQQFRLRWFEDKNAGMPKQRYFPDWQPKPSVNTEFNKLIYKRAVRVLKKDCLDLPPLVKKQIFVELGAEQSRMYEQMKKEFIAYLGDKTCVASMALTKGLRLQQILSGYFKTDDGEEIIYKQNPRIDALKDILQEIMDEKKKVIIWSCFRQNYKMIADLMAGDVCMLYGGMTEKQRQESIDNFQNNETYNTMIANQGAGGVGVNLTAASYAVYFSRNFSLEFDLQSESRCHRSGSEQHEKITRIDIVAPNTIDEVILEALLRKENIANNILQIKDRL